MVLALAGCGGGDGTATGGGSPGTGLTVPTANTRPVAVALLAVRGPASIDPVLCRVPAGLPSRDARVFALCVCSLLPGSLGADLDGDHYVVHALTGTDKAVGAAMHDIERHVAAVFGCSLIGTKP